MFHSHSSDIYYPSIEIRVIGFDLSAHKLAVLYTRRHPDAFCHLCEARHIICSSPRAILHVVEEPWLLE